MLFCEVIIPLSVSGTFTYRIPDEWKNIVTKGMRVVVQFGKRKHYTGLVYSVHQHAPTKYAAKNILEIIDEQPIVHEIQIQFWEWMSAYYCCQLGDVMSAALPAFFRQDSETQYSLSPQNEMDIIDLPDDEYLVASALEQQADLSLQDIQAILQKKSVQKVIQSLIQRKVMVIREFIEERYKPKLETYVRISPHFIEEGKYAPKAFQLLEKRPKQTDVLLSYFSLAPKGQWVTRNELLKNSSASGAVFKALVQSEIFEVEDRQVSRVEDEDIRLGENTLNDNQNRIYHQIHEQWENHSVVLLRGVTASGKTHVYVELIKDAIQKGQQVLYLVPEISLTAQLIRRLKKLLGIVGVYHSKFNPAERVETWLKVLRQEMNIVVGARSALFLPFSNLGLIVIDEEHDASYKQQDPAPRFQARDSAIWLAQTAGAKVILGSATPSLDSWANAKANKYGYVELTQRHGDMRLPNIDFINLTQARKRSLMTGLLSSHLIEAIQKSLDEKRQVIVFQNRRGYAPYITCKECAWIPYCPHCDVSLTFHKFSEQLKCHYCGYSTGLPKECSVCSSTLLEMRGAGTEKIEDDIQAVFPTSKLLRLDYDTARGKLAHEKIILQFEKKEADILIGTQMVTKGLDFKNVQLVAVLQADALLYYPDFRATERAFQLLSQVSGRAGRSDASGQVMIQMSNTQHAITRYLKEDVIEEFYTNELNERKLFKYPPYVRLIHLILKDRLEKNVHQAAQFVMQQLQPRIQGECLGPSVPSISKIQGKHLREILIKLPKNSEQIQAAKNSIEAVRKMMYQYADFKKVHLIINVDP